MCAAGIRPSSLTRARDSFWWVSINSRLWFCWLLFHCFFCCCCCCCIPFLFLFVFWLQTTPTLILVVFFIVLPSLGLWRSFSVDRYVAVLRRPFFTEFFYFFHFSIEVFFCYGRRWGPWRRKMCRDSIFRPSSSFAYQSGLGGNQKGHRRRRLRLDPNDE